MDIHKPVEGDKQYVSSQWYLDRYEDLKRAGVEPTHHFFNYGFLEGRDPNPVFSLKFYRETYLGCESTINPLLHFLRIGCHKGYKPNPLCDLPYIIQHYKCSPTEVLGLLLSEQSDIDKVSNYFSRKYFLKLYKSNNSKNAAERLWLDSLYKHSINCSAEYDLINLSQTRSLSSVSRGSNFHLTSFFYSGDQFLFAPARLNDILLKEIQGQSVFEEEITAFNKSDFYKLRQFESADILTRGGFDSASLIQEVQGDFRAVIIIPELTMGGAEKYAANLANSILEESGSMPLIITTNKDEISVNFKESCLYSGFSKFQRAKFGWWTARASGDKSQILALLLMRISPSSIFILNSEVGYEAVKKFGLQLSQISKIYCAFFSNAPREFGLTFGQIFSRQVIKYSYIISDNKKYLRSLDEQLNGIFSNKLIYLPNYSEPEKVEDIRKKSCRLLWASRWSPEKAVEVLRELALLDRTITIDVFGVSKSQIQELSRWPKNIIFNGVYEDIYSINLLKYTAFIYTSYYDGMPNVLIEFGQAGIPLIASDVGGISETFHPDQVELIDMSGIPSEIASKYLKSVYKLYEESEKERVARIGLIKSQCELHHSKSQFLGILRGLI